MWKSFSAEIQTEIYYTFKDCASDRKYVTYFIFYYCTKYPYYKDTIPAHLNTSTLNIQTREHVPFMILWSSSHLINIICFFLGGLLVVCRWTNSSVHYGFLYFFFTNYLEFILILWKLELTSVVNANMFLICLKMRGWQWGIVD